MVSDKTIHKAFRTPKTLFKQNPLLRDFGLFVFSIYQSSTLALSEIRESANYK